MEKACRRSCHALYHYSATTLKELELYESSYCLIKKVFVKNKTPNYDSKPYYNKTNFSKTKRLSFKVITYK